MKINFSQSLQISLVLSWKSIVLLFKILSAVALVYFCIILIDPTQVSNLENYSPSRFSIVGFILGFDVFYVCLFRNPFNKGLKRSYKNFQLNFVSGRPSLSFYLKWTLLSELLWYLICSILEYWFFKVPMTQYLLSIIGLANTETPLYFAGVEFLFAFFINTFVLAYLLNREMKASKVDFVWFLKTESSKPPLPL